MQAWFDRVIEWLTDTLGSPLAILLTVAAVLARVGFDATIGLSAALIAAYTLTLSELAILIGLIILAAQNKSERAMQLKLDETIRATAGARNELIDAEHQSAEHIQAQKQRMTQDQH